MIADDRSRASATTRSTCRFPLPASPLALLLSTLGILSIGFLIASLVPTARFAQPVGTLILYPMIGLSGLFVPVASLPPALRPSRG